MRCTSFFLLSLVLFTTTVFAQPLADRVRPDAIVYFGWSGAKGMGAGYANSHLKAVLDESNFDAVINDFLPRVLDRIAKEADSGEFNAVRTAVLEIAAPMWDHPTAFYLGGVELKDRNTPPIPRVALLCRAGADAPKMLARLKELTKKMDKDVPLRFAQVNDLIVVAFGFDRAESALATSGKALAQDAGYRAALANCHKEPLAALYLDFAKLLAVADKAVETYDDEDEVKSHWKRIRDISGLGGLKRVMLTEAFEGKEWGSRGFVEAPAPRKGLLKVLESAPVTEAALQSIPKTSTIAGVAKFDFAKLIATVRAGITEFNPDAGAQVDQVLAQVRDSIGIDVQKDLLEPIGDEWAFYTDPLGGGKGMLGFTVVNRLRDPAKAESSLTKLAQLANALIEEQLRDEKVTIAFKQQKVGSLNIHYLALPLVTPAWAIEGDNLFIGLFPQTVAVAAEHVRSKSPSILENEQFLAARKSMGGGANATSIQFIDLPRTAPDAYPGWLMISRVVGVGDLFGVDSPAIVGPPLKILLANLTPAVTVTWGDDKGWYVHSRVPFPGSNMLASDPFGGAFNSLGTAMQMMGAMK